MVFYLNFTISSLTITLSDFKILPPNRSSFSNLLTSYYSSFQFLLLPHCCFPNQFQITYPYLEGHSPLCSCLHLLPYHFQFFPLCTLLCASVFPKYENALDLCNVFAWENFNLFLTYSQRRKFLSCGLKFVNTSGSKIPCFVCNLLHTDLSIPLPHI